MFRDVGTGILAEEGRRKDLLPPILPPWRRQRLVVYCNGRCTGAAGRRIRPHPAFWELRSLPRIYEVINEIKNAAGKRRKKNRKKKQSKTKQVEPGQVLGPCSSLGFDFLLLLLWEMPRIISCISLHSTPTVLGIFLRLSKAQGFRFNLREPGPSCLTASLTCSVFFPPLQVQISKLMIITVKYEFCKVLYSFFILLAINLGRIFTGRIRCGGLISAKNEHLAGEKWT